MRDVSCAALSELLQLIVLIVSTKQLYVVPYVDLD